MKKFNTEYEAYEGMRSEFRGTKYLIIREDGTRLLFIHDFHPIFVRQLADDEDEERLE